jgi:hypothetical protein
MFRRRFFPGILGTLLILTLLVVGGFAIHRAGVAQGYTLGLQASAAEAGEAVPLPVAPYSYPGYGYGFRPFFGGFGFLLMLGLGFLFFAFIARFFFFGWAWRRWAGGPHGGAPWAKHWKHHHGRVPPWHDDWDEEETPDEPGEPKASQD